MKRLLLISYVFPPEPSPGALRPGFLARYLPEFGWDVTVLTRRVCEPPFAVRTVATHAESGVGTRAGRTSSRSGPIRRALSAAKEALLFPDHVAPWIPSAIAAGRKLIRTERFDAILSTALPASVHVVGSALAKESDTPWIADYRDPWNGNAYLHRGPVRGALERAAERRLLQHARTLTTISPAIAERLSQFHARDDVRVLPNAYDPAEWEAIPSEAPERFDLCYTGSLYDGKRSPDLLFQAISDLRREGEPAGVEARVDFYGPCSGTVTQSAARADVSPLVREHGPVARVEAMRAQRKAAVLLLLLSMDPTTAHEMGSKYLEYAGAGRPILAFGPRESVMREFILRNNLGWFSSTLEEAKSALRAAHAGFLKGELTVSVPAGALPTARDLARRFAAILDQAVPTFERSIAS